MWASAGQRGRELQVVSGSVGAARFDVQSVVARGTRRRYLSEVSKVSLWRSTNPHRESRCGFRFCIGVSQPFLYATSVVFLYGKFKASKMDRHAPQFVQEVFLIFSSSITRLTVSPRIVATFSVIAILDFRLRTVCHQPLGTNIVSPFFCSQV